MIVSYKKMFDLLGERGLKKTEFAKAVGISQNTLAKLGKNKIVSLEILAKICIYFKCSIGDLIDIVGSTDD